MNRIRYNSYFSDGFDFDELLIFLLIILNFRRDSYKYNLYNFKNAVKNSDDKNEMKDNVINGEKNQIERSKINKEDENKLLSGSGGLLKCLKCDEKKQISAQSLPLAIEDEKKVKLNNLFVKMPVVLAQKSISITLEPVYNFDDDVLEIKSVKEQAYLKKTDLIMLPHEISEIPSGKLFINGFVRKSIEYVALNEQNNEYAIGTVKNIIANIPFLFTSIIEFDILPAINKNMYLEPIYCDIEKQHINETEIYDIIERGKEESPINVFKRIHEKMVIDLDVKILQKQIVNITKIYQS